MKAKKILFSLLFILLLYSCGKSDSETQEDTFSSKITFAYLNQNNGNISLVDIDGKLYANYISLPDTEDFSDVATDIKWYNKKLFITKKNKVYSIDIDSKSYSVVYEDNNDGLQYLLPTQEGIYLTQNNTGGPYRLLLVNYSGDVVNSVNIPDDYGPSGFCMVGDNIYVIGSHWTGWTPDEGKLFIVNKNSFTIQKTVLLGKKNPYGHSIICTSNYIYVLTTGDYSSEEGAIVKLDLDGNILKTTEVGGSPTGIYLANNKIYITYNSGNKGLAIYSVINDVLERGANNPLFSGKAFDGGCVGKISSSFFKLSSTDDVWAVGLGSGYTGENIYVIEVSTGDYHLYEKENIKEAGWTQCAFISH